VQSGLYRIVYRGEREPDPAPTPAELDARATRARLRAAPLSLPDEPWARERHARHVFRTALEGRPTSEWEPLLADAGPLSRADADLARARVAPTEEVRELLARLVERPLDLTDEVLAAVALRTLEVALLRAGEVAPELRARLAERLLAVFPCGSRDLDRELGVLLAGIPEAEERFVPLALQRLAVAPDGAEAFHWTLLLRQARRGWTPEGRRQFFTWLQSADAAFDGGRAVPIFLRELRRDALATLSEDERAALGSLLEPGSADDVATTARAFVQAWRMQDLEPGLADAIEGQRDLARGPRLLREAQCLTCHRVDGRGQALGPELDGLAGRFAPLDLLESLLAPSREVPERYRDTLITTSDGRLHIGRLVGEEEGALLLLDSYGARTVLRIPRSEILEQAESPVSPMPEGLLDTFTREEIYDLVAYLLQDAD
jgi:putative heme-binding domain-containing protein